MKTLCFFHLENHVSNKASINIEQIDSEFYFNIYPEDSFY